MSNVALTELLTGARLYADERPGGSTAFISDSDGLRLVKRSVMHLRDEVIAAGGHEYFVTDTTFATSSGTNDYSLPSDHMETLLVQVVWGASDVEDVGGWEWDERGALESLGTWGRGNRKGYRLTGSEMSLYPTPSAENTVRHVYVKRWNQNDTVIDMGLDGWEDYVELDVAVRMRAIQQLPYNDLIALRDEALQRIQNMANDRAAREPLRVTDVAPESAYVGRRRWWPSGGY